MSIPIRPSRRRFLQVLGAAGGALALGPFERLARATPEPEMAIARWGPDPLPADRIPAAARTLTARALSALGGMERFVSKGDVIWVKPNIGWNRAPELAACTNPQVVATLTRLCYEAGAKTVKVGDHTCHEARQCYPNSGIEAAAKEAGAEIVYLDPNRFRDVDLGGERLKSWPLYPEILETDLVINVPIAKHHGLARATLAMKNYMGVIGGRRGAWHQDLARCLVDVTRYMKPRLTVLDAVRVLTDNGPQGGDPDDVKTLGVVAAGTDVVAIDAFGAELLGHDPRRFDSIRLGEEAGLGRGDYRSLPLEEMTVS
ncbi:MAG: DUF362 domain-containing protein [Candidatus Eisenbacteria bacterium]|nr:DUF362 domain-containing protein [Candidatus Latescibacterota bacterium]MBD3301354.1 DUF362 domain-containing protein [Candidatus Eisenbacteria bacterium]